MKVCLPSVPSAVFCLLLMTQIAPTSLISQTFSSTGSMPVPLAYQTATLLQDGTVLIAGGANPGTGATSNATIYNPTTKIFVPTFGKMNAARYAHTATLLANGQVLIAGGGDSSGNPVASAELYSAATGTFATVGSMKTARNYATATLLQDGTVLIAGGVFQLGTSTAEIYDPAKGTFSATGNMTTKRASHTATLLSDGSVLIAGGIQNYSGETVLKTAERYVPSSKQFSAVGSMAAARAGQTASLLIDGTVLFAGGIDQSGNPLSSAEVYTPSTNSFSAVASLRTARAVHAATPLKDGTVLIAGGSVSTLIAPVPFAPYTSSVEVYNPSSQAFTSTGSMVTARGGQTATLLQDGTVLEAGGGYGSGNSYTATAEIYTYPFTAGAMTPKYIVLGVIYSPPGAASSVTYTQSTAVGTSSSITGTFQQGTTVSASLGISGGSKSVTGSITGTVSNTYSQLADSISTYTINKTTTQAIAASGPLSSAIGVDHDYDTVLVWLNPKVNLSVGGLTTNILWNGYSFDSRDTYSPNAPDIVTLSIFCLKNPFSAPTCTDNNARTSRSWDTTSSLGGLTIDDYLEIAQRDPFYLNPSYDPNNDPNNRFTFTKQSVDYTPAAPGDGAETWSGSLNYVATSVAGQDATDSYSVSYGLDAGIKGVISGDLNNTKTTTWTNKWSETQTNTVSQNAAYSITGPLATDNYTGPTGYEVWQDNVYGTFVFVAPGTTPLSPGSFGISPATINFGSVAVGNASNPVKVTLTNNSTLPMYMGIAPIPPNQLPISPVAAFSDLSFSIVPGSDACTGVSVNPGATCTLSVRFSPLASDTIGSGGLISGGMYLTGETDAAVQGILPLSGTEAPAAGAAATPTVSIGCPQKLGNLMLPGGVNMGDTTPGAVIYYTTDGTAPTTSSTQFTGIFQITQTTVFKSIAVASGYKNSAVATVTLTPPSCVIHL